MYIITGIESPKRVRGREKKNESKISGMYSSGIYQSTSQNLNHNYKKIGIFVAIRLPIKIPLIF